ncbi:MAG: D-glycerate dehydrogenase [Chloroflexi bacterium]|nr:D-glycerate dehydrogenase [Chloroflexota bacterium]
MNPPKIFVSRSIPERGLKMIMDRYSVIIWPGELPPTRGQLIQQVRGIDGFLSLLTDRIDEELMDLIGPQLKVISNMAVGVDNIDLIAATARGIPVGNTPDVLTDATADQAFALMLAAARRFLEADRFLRAGKWITWSPSLLLGADFVDATLGIVGFGRIGRAIAKRALGFDMHVIFHDPSAGSEFNAQPVELDTLLRLSDFISINVPLTYETHHLVNAKFLSRMKSNAILVNTSRGGVVDQAALYDALISRKIFAAALDVTDPEPLPLDCPLLELENCIIMPHLGSASRRTREMMSLLAAENLIAGIEGKRLPNCVNPQVYS